MSLLSTYLLDPLCSPLPWLDVFLDPVSILTFLVCILLRGCCVSFCLLFYWLIIILAIISITSGIRVVIVRCLCTPSPSSLFHHSKVQSGRSGDTLDAMS